MPLYEYRCKACSHVFEKIQSFSAPEEKECPVCKGEVERLISAPAIQFKGAGWYVNDYAGKSSASKADSSNSDSSPSASDSSSSSKSENSKNKSAPAASTPANSSSGSSSSSSGSNSSGSAS